MSLEAVEFSPGLIVQTVVGMFRRQAADKGLSLDAVVDPAAPERVLGDPVRFRQVLTNLVGNAVKFTQAGGAMVRLTPGDAPGMVRVAVRDSGVGVPPGRLESIFDPFKQADGSITRRFGGTGLGLALVKRLVGLMGGEVEVSSTVGLGSEFRFSARFAPYAAPVRETIAAPKTVLPDNHPPPLAILLVEDNPVNIKLGLAMLGKLGVEVRVAGDGEEALWALAEFHADLVLMDLEMPIMDGLEAARRIRAGEAGEAARDTPIYALTAHALPEYESVCFDVGMNGCLTKPLSFAGLAAFLGEFSAARDRAKASNSHDPPVLCRDSALALCGDEQTAATLARVFLTDLPIRRRALRSALETLDRPALKIAAHSLKSSCAVVGAGACREAAATLESLLDRDADADPTDPTRRLLGALDVLGAALTGKLADQATATVGPSEHRA